MNFVDQVHSSDESIEEFKQLAAIGYTPRKIALYYTWNVRDFETIFDTSPKLQELYEAGQLEYEGKIAIASLSGAAGGTIVHAQRLDKIATAKKFEESKRIIMYDEES